MATPPTVLLVEDDRDIREAVLEALEDEGYSATGAIDGLDALATLRRSEMLPDLILLDLMMPRMNGTEFQAEMAKDADWSSVPIIVLSAHAQVGAKAAAMGAAGFLKKPVKLGALFELVTRVLSDGGPAKARGTSA